VNGRLLHTQTKFLTSKNVSFGDDSPTKLLKIQPWVYFVLNRPPFRPKKKKFTRSSFCHILQLTGGTGYRAYTP
jgi:hypothetical protein